MYKFIIALIFISFFGFDCGNSISENSDKYVVKSGTSFGMCAGYCIAEIEISNKNVTFSRSGWEPGNPVPKKIEGTISADEWENLAEEIDPNVLKSLDEVYGCPDCADGGAEWIEIEAKDFKKKITFEYSKTIQPINELIIKVREIRNKFEVKLPR